MSHLPTRSFLGSPGLAGRRVWCAGDPSLADLATVSSAPYDVAVVAVDWTELPDATKGVRAVLDGLAARGVAVTSVAHPVGTVAGYAVGDPLEAAYAGAPWQGALAAHVAEYGAAGCRTQVITFVGVAIVVAFPPS